VRSTLETPDARIAFAEAKATHHSAPAIKQPCAKPGSIAAARQKKYRVKMRMPAISAMRHLKGSNPVDPAEALTGTFPGRARDDFGPGARDPSPQFFRRLEPMVRHCEGSHKNFATGPDVRLGQLAYLLRALARNLAGAVRAPPNAAARRDPGEAPPPLLERDRDAPRDRAPAAARDRLIGQQSARGGARPERLPGRTEDAKSIRAPSPCHAK